MKKFFTLIAAVAMAASMNAQTTLIDYPTSQDGITLHNADDGISFATVKIHLNKDNVNAIKVGKSYTTDKLVADNFVELTTEGGFKKGDVVTIAGAFNNADDTKKAKIDIFTGAVGEAPTVLFTTQQFINGRLVDDEPVEETYTLAADAASLQLGRNGNTGVCITKLTVVRGGGDATGISNIEAASAKQGKTYNVAGQEVSASYKGLVIKNGKKYVK